MTAPGEWLGSARSAVARSLLEFEEAWLDPIDGGRRDLLAESGWSPDPLDAYCDVCGHTVGPSEGLEVGCVACERLRLPWSRFVRLGAYEPPLSDAILRVKFGRARTQARELGRLLGVSARNAGVLTGGEDLEVVVVPVPMPRVRYLSRGIDHTGAIASSMAEELGVRVCGAVSARFHASQRTVPASGRRANVRGVYRVKRAFRGRFGGEGVRFVVLDDVVTTGSTARAVCGSLKKAFPGAQVWVSSVSVADRGTG